MGIHLIHFASVVRSLSTVNSAFCMVPFWFVFRDPSLSAFDFNLSAEQLCYAAKTWHGGFLWMMIFGASEVSRNVDLGDETSTMMCKFVVRASDASITKEIESDLQGWLDDLTDGGCEYKPEDEVKTAAAERLRISMERIALLKAAKPRPKTDESDGEEQEGSSGEELDDEERERRKKKEKKKDEEDKNSTLSKLTAEEVEHRALQSLSLIHI